MELNEFDESDTINLQDMLSIISNTSRYHSSKLENDTHLLSLLKSKSVFPLYDLLRIIMLHPNGFNNMNTLKKFVSNALDALNTGNDDKILLTSMRFLCNLFSFKSTNATFVNKLKEYLITNISMMIEVINKHVFASNKLIRASLTAFLLNTTIFLGKNITTDIANQIVNTIAIVLNNDDPSLNNSDCLIRSSLTFGNLIWYCGNMQFEFNIKELVQDIKKKFGTNDKFVAVLDDILKKL